MEECYIDFLKSYDEERKKAEKKEFSDKLEISKKYYEDQKKLVEKEIVIRDLLYADYAEKVKAHKSRYDYMFNTFKDAISELNKKDNDTGKLNFINHLICNDFFNGNEEFKIFSIIAGGFETYSWCVYLHKEKGNINICITIPVMDNINIKNFEWSNYGMFSCSAVDNTDSVRMTKFISNSYFIEDIAEEIDKYISNIK